MTAVKVQGKLGDGRVGDGLKAGAECQVEGWRPDRGRCRSGRLRPRPGRVACGPRRAQVDRAFQWLFEQRVFALA